MVSSNYKASEHGALFKIAKQIDVGTQKTFTPNPDLNDYYQGGNTIGQMALQIGLGVASGGLAAPLIYGSALGAASQYEDADKTGASGAVRKGAAILGGITAISDALPVAWALKPILRGGNSKFLSGFLNGIFQSAVKEVGEKEATAITQGVFRRLIDSALSKGKTVATGAGFEVGQEVLLDKKPNDLYASLTYDPKRKVWEINDEDITTAMFAALGGGFAGIGKLAIENAVENVKSNNSIFIPNGVDPQAFIDGLIAKLNEGVKQKEITPEQFAKAKKQIIKLKETDAKIPKSPAAPLVEEPLAKDTVAKGEDGSVSVEGTIKPEQLKGLPEQLKGLFSGMAQGISENMRTMLWEKVEKGDTTEAGGPSAVLDVAAKVREKGGLKTREEFDRFVDDFGSSVAGKTGEEFQTAARTLALKYSEPPKATSVSESEPDTPAVQNNAAAPKESKELQDIQQSIDYKKLLHDAPGTTAKQKELYTASIERLEKEKAKVPKPLPPMTAQGIRLTEKEKAEQAKNPKAAKPNPVAQLKADPRVGTLMADWLLDGKKETLDEIREIGKNYGTSEKEIQGVIDRAKAGWDKKQRESKANDIVREERRPKGPVSAGSETTVEIPDTGKSYQARYVVRELSDVFASHNPVTFQPNPDYHFVNDRHYDKEQQYQLGEFFIGNFGWFGRSGVVQKAQADIVFLSVFVRIFAERSAKSFVTLHERFAGNESAAFDAPAHVLFGRTVRWRKYGN